MAINYLQIGTEGAISSVYYHHSLTSSLHFFFKAMNMDALQEVYQTMEKATAKVRRLIERKRKGKKRVHRKSMRKSDTKKQMWPSPRQQRSVCLHDNRSRLTNCLECGDPICEHCMADHWDTVHDVQFLPPMYCRIYGDAVDRDNKDSICDLCTFQSLSSAPKLTLDLVDDDEGDDDEDDLNKFNAADLKEEHLQEVEELMCDEADSDFDPDNVSSGGSDDSSSSGYDCDDDEEEEDYHDYDDDGDDL